MPIQLISMISVMDIIFEWRFNHGKAKREKVRQVYERRAEKY